MAKTFTVNLDHIYSSRGESMTVRDALAWVEKHMSGEDPETGESTGPSYAPGDLLVYAVRRLMALHKDGRRHAAGKLAAHLYSPRLDAVKAPPRALVQAVEAIDRAAEKLTPPAKPTRKPAAKPERKVEKAKTEPARPSGRS